MARGHDCGTFNVSGRNIDRNSSCNAILQNFEVNRFWNSNVTFRK